MGFMANHLITAKPFISPAPANLTAQLGIVAHTAYPSCRDGSAVELYVVQGVGHLWPPPSILPASRIIWDFFAAHPKPAG